MHSFSKKVLLLLVTVIAFEAVLSFLLEPVTYQHFLEIELEQDEKEGRMPDTVVIGNSSVEMAFIPSVLEAGIQDADCVLNAATGSQMIWGSYYYLKDLFNSYDIKSVTVGIDYSGFVRQAARVPKRDLVVMDRIQSPGIKAEYIWKHLEAEEYPLLLTSYRYRDQIGSIGENVQAKLARDYRQGIDTRKGTYYQERGFIHSTAKGELHTGIYGYQEVDMEQMSAEAVEYLDKIVELCEENNAQLYLVVPPIAFTGIYSSQTYQSCVDYFTAYAQEKGVTFWDLNLIKDRQTVLPDAMLSDGDHLGEEGAVICSSFYSELVEAKRAGKDTAPYFYASVEEMKADIHGIVECNVKSEPYGKNGDRMLEAQSIHGKDCTPEYEFWVREAGSEWIRLQEYGEGTECLVPAKYLEEGVYFQINCRRAGSDAKWESRTQVYREPDM